MSIIYAFLFNLSGWSVCDDAYLYAPPLFDPRQNPLLRQVVQSIAASTKVIKCVVAYVNLLSYIILLSDCAHTQ